MSSSSGSFFPRFFAFGRAALFDFLKHGLGRVRLALCQESQSLIDSRRRVRLVPFIGKRLYGVRKLANLVMQRFLTLDCILDLVTMAFLQRFNDVGHVDAWMITFVACWEKTVIDRPNTTDDRESRCQKYRCPARITDSKLPNFLKAH